MGRLDQKIVKISNYIVFRLGQESRQIVEYSFVVCGLTALVGGKSCTKLTSVLLRIPQTHLTISLLLFWWAG